MNIRDDQRLIDIAQLEDGKVTMTEILGCLTDYFNLTVFYVCIRYINRRYIHLPNRPKLINILNIRLAQLRLYCNGRILNEVRTFILRFKAFDIKDCHAYVHDYPDYNKTNFFTREVIDDLFNILNK